MIDFNDAPAQQSVHLIDLIAEGARLKREIDAATERLHVINKTLEAQAPFKEGTKTAYFIGAGYRVKIEKRSNIKWDQDKLLQVKHQMPEAFTTTFKAEYKPVSKNLTIMMTQNPDFKKAIDWAREIKPGVPSVTYEPLEEVA